MPHGIGQITRIGASTGLRPRESAAFMNAVQRVAVERTRLGIPVLVHEEAVGGLCQRDATVFPQALGLAATWDPALVEQRRGGDPRADARRGRTPRARPGPGRSARPALGPRRGDLRRGPRADRTLGAAYIGGCRRRPAPRRGGHGQALPRLRHVGGWPQLGAGAAGSRELREVYAEPFAAAIREAGLAAVMNSYASIDGLPCAGSRAILTGLLREELGFNGVVVADYFSVAQLHGHHRVAADPGEAARRALSAGLDMELPATRFYGEPLKAEIAAGRMLHGGASIRRCDGLR